MGLGWVVLGLGLCASGAECAEPEAEAETEEHEDAERPRRSRAARPEPTWYGDEILIADGASLALGIGLRASLDIDPRRRPSTLGLIAAVWYGGGALAAPAVHYAHGQAGLGVADLGLRLFAPLFPALIGWVAACTSNNDFDRDCAERGLGAGTLVGLAGMTALDAGLFAWERPHRAPPKPEREWYGWQLLFLDGAAIAAGVAFAQSDPETKDGEPLHPAAATWAMGYTVGLLAGPIVHFTHGRVGTGFASFGARALVGPMFALPGFIGYCAATAGVRGCASTGAQWGLLGGLVAVDLFDALVLAHEPVVGEQAYRPSLYVGQSTLGLAGYWP